MGKTRVGVVRGEPPEVHPHACGENEDEQPVPPAAPGSPPRLWGKRAWSTPTLPLNRFTPTPVGKTRPCRSSESAAPVHPHACGENIDQPCERGRWRGSPPRLWGKRVESSTAARLARFTPTPVGKTPSPAQTRQDNRVHPHACGENESGAAWKLYWSGSPPRLWGKRSDASVTAANVRFTPTPVGKTVTPPTARRAIRVHPHACGENAPVSPFSPLSPGSPPRLWGKQSRQPLGHLSGRFTPTPVGKTMFVM